MDDLRDFIKAALKSLPGYTDFGHGERHGSYEWNWFRQDKDMARFVSLALTPEHKESRQYRVEIWAGADNKERFARHLVAHFSGVDPTKMGEPLQKQLPTVLNQAAKHAEALSARDLDNIRFMRERPEEKVLEELGNPPSVTGKG